MSVADTLRIAFGLPKKDEQPHVPHVDPSITVGAGQKFNAAQIVLGLARDLRGDALGVPGLPASAFRVLRALGSSEGSAREIAEIVRSDPALASAILRGAGPALDLDTALMRLDGNRLRALAMAFAMKEMEKQDWPDAFRPLLAEIRSASQGVARLCFATARQVPGVDADEALATGFFHLVGKLYLLARARQEGIAPADVTGWMRALKGWHPTIGRTILDHWKMPGAVAEAVEQQNAILESEDGKLAPLALILCASKLYYRLRRPDAAREPEAEAALARVRLHGQTFDDLQKAIRAA